MEIEIKGHSGCTIDIVREAGQLYVLKQTNDINYLERLHKQAQKQDAAYGKEFQYIQIPKIHSIVRTKSSLQVKMEYVYSKNFIEHFEDAGFEQINYFIQALVHFIQREISESPLLSINKSVFLDKFKAVSGKIESNLIFSGDNEIAEILKVSAKIFAELPEEMELPVGSCHGDLTFSNILFNGNNCYLIDFLDSFIETPLMDMVKIRQDSAYLWSTLMYEKSFDAPRLRMIAEKIDNQLVLEFQLFAWYNDFYDSFQLMNFLRILQYAHEEKVIGYLKKVIKSIIRK
jgi:thiamine kinase-like enzyme